MNPVYRVIQEVANNLMSLVHKTVENGLALLPGGQGKKFDKLGCYGAYGTW